MTRHTTFRFCMDPTAEQQRLLDRHAGASRVRVQPVSTHGEDRAHRTPDRRGHGGALIWIRSD
ncbi:helix-turn-helix domain-containing protein [Mycobacterium sp.]|uniref:helix-turn-helix domain-containing protein n=1 Tax=Mycobacterium sp. TaxID=1785 RepID=UPI003F9D6C55